MHPTRLDWFLELRPWMQSIDVFMRDAFATGDKRGYVTNVAITLETRDEKSVAVSIQEAPLRWSMEDAQQIMNELWRIGIRPRDGAGTLAHVDASKAHLEDMRRLVFEGRQKP